MKTLKLLLQNKDGGAYTAVSMVIEVPECGYIGAILEGAYKKLERDLEKLDWRDELETAPKK